MSAANRHVFDVAIQAGERFILRAKGDPARIVAYGAAGAVVFAGTLVVYGSYVHGRRLLGWGRPR